MEDATLTPAAEPAMAVILPAELEVAAADAGLSTDGIRSLRVAFAPHFFAFHEIADRARAIGENSPKAARVARLELRAVRVAAEKTRKELKDDSLRRGRAIDGINAVLEYRLVPVENALEAIEKAEERAEEARKSALKASRTEALAPYANTEFYDLAGMPEGAWTDLLAGAKAAHEAKIAAFAKAEADRIAAERAAAEEKAKRDAEAAAERERMRVENARLAEVAAKERAAREEQEVAARAERAKADAAAKKEREDADARQQALREQFRKDQATADAKAADERRAREKAEAALAEQKKQEAARVAKERAAAKKAAAAPDRQKLMTFATQVRSMRPMALSSTPEAKALAVRIDEQCQKFAAWVELEAEKL